LQWRSRKIIRHSHPLLLARTAPAQTSQMHFRSKEQAARARQTSNPREHKPRMPSTAWLAAQDAFSAPRPVPAAEPALVVVRRGRAPEPELQGLASPAATQPVLADRPARVFRVVTAPAADAGPALPPPELPLAPAAAPAVATQARRRRRVDLDKRPGPVQHIVHATRAPVESVVAAPVRSLSPGEEIAALQAMMARLNAVFDEIGAARAFHFLA